MKLVDELFKRYILIDDTLIKYGFIKKDNIYSYNKPIHDNGFELQISIKNKIINAKLIDKFLICTVLVPNGFTGLFF